MQKDPKTVKSPVFQTPFEEVIESLNISWGSVFRASKLTLSHVRYDWRKEVSVGLMNLNFSPCKKVHTLDPPPTQ